jgi:hypothetical protein
MSQVNEELSIKPVSFDIDEFRISELINQDFMGKDYYVMGHQNDLAVSHQVEADLLIQLNKLDSVKYLVLDIDAGQAKRFNEFLKDGDESVLRDVLFGWRVQKSSLNCQDVVDKLRKIKNHNDTLTSKDLAIEIVGIDRIQNFNIIYKYINQIAEYGQSAATDTLIDIMDWGYKYQDRSKIERLAASILDDLSKDSIIFRSVSEADITFYHQIVYNIANMENAPSELRLYNLQQFINAHKKVKFLLSVSYFDAVSFPVSYTPHSLTFHLTTKLDTLSKSTILLAPLDCKAHRLVKPSFDLTPIRYSFDDPSFFNLNYVDAIKSKVLKDINVFNLEALQKSNFHFLIKGDNTRQVFEVEDENFVDLQYNYFIIIKNGNPVTLLE